MISKICLMFICCMRVSHSWSTNVGFLNSQRHRDTWNCGSVQELRNKCSRHILLHNFCLQRPRKLRRRGSAVHIAPAATMRQELPVGEDPFFSELLTDDGLRMSESPFRWQRVNWGGLLLSTLKSRIFRRV